MAAEKGADMSLDYIQTLSNYLGCKDYLAFRSPEYLVQGPACDETEARTMCLCGSLRFLFKNPETQETWGTLDVAPFARRRDTLGRLHRDESCFVIADIRTHPAYSAATGHGLGYGIERVRRLVLFAFDWGYARVETTSFGPGGGTHALGLGFRNMDALRPDWDQAGDLQDEALKWKEKVKNDADSVWEMARTKVGRRVLNKMSGKGILQFDDTKQRRYVFERLGLN